MRVLVLSSVFPNPKQPTYGTFVRERVARLATHCDVRVVAAVPWFPLNRLFRGRERTGIPGQEAQGSLTVYHPKAFSVPGIMKALDGLFYFLSVLPTVARIRRSFPFDVIDAHFAYPDGMAAWLLGKVFRCPVAVTLRGTIVPLSRFRLRRPQIMWSLRGVNRILSVSESLKTLAVSLGIPAEKIRVIPNGVDTRAFAPSSREDARRALGLPADRRILVSVGALAPRKGHQRVLEILPEVIAVHPDLLFVVVGGSSVEGNTGPLLRRMAEDRGLAAHVILAGRQPHEALPRWLAAADLFCLATSNEGRANVILEALACGLPVVTTDVGGSREIVRDGRTGILAPAGDPVRLAAAIIDGLARPWDRDAIAAEATCWCWDRTALDTLEELQRLVHPQFDGSDPLAPAIVSNPERPQ